MSSQGAALSLSSGMAPLASYLKPDVSDSRSGHGEAPISCSREALLMSAWLSGRGVDGNWTQLIGTYPV